jgi:hypothetical protein
MAQDSNDFLGTFALQEQQAGGMDGPVSGEEEHPLCTCAFLPVRYADMKGQKVYIEGGHVARAPAILQAEEEEDREGEAHSELGAMRRGLAPLPGCPERT